MDRLRQACGVEAHAALLSRGHLVRRVVRRAAIRTRPEREQSLLPAAMVPMNAAVLNRIGESACAGVGRVLAGLDADVGLRERWGRAALGHPSGLVRFTAWRATPRRTAIDYAFDRDAGIARSAALAACGESGPWPALVRSEHPAVRTIAADELAKLGLSWIDRSDAILGLRRRATREPAAMEREWKRRWESADARERVTLLKLARRVGLAERVADIASRVIDPASEPGSDAAKLTATAVACLDDSDAARACLHAADPRVRSNAAEAIAAEHAGSLMELKSDANHRVRASVLRRLAVAGLLPAASLVAELIEMSDRDEQTHRLAAAWLVSRVAGVVDPGAAAALVERRLGAESDARVRARLADAARRYAGSVSVQREAA
jgi:hypothetical protein